MIHYLLTLSYDGTAYYGWQHNSSTFPSIEGELQSALQKVYQKNVSLDAASRTDRGVHAEEQLVAFSVPFSKKTAGQLHLSLNQLLPNDIRVLSLEETTTRVYPSIDSTEKEYEYVIDTASYHNPFMRHRAWHVPKPLSREKMERAAQLLVGTHDFAGFTNEGAPKYTSTIRTINYIHISLEESFIRVRMCAEAFLFRMARNIVGTLVDIGSGKIPLETIPLLLNSKQRPLGGVTAPAHGLVLKRIKR